MSSIEALLLGVLQGLTEFLPVSSSAHLKLAQTLFGYDPSADLFFPLICHIGTAFAAIFFFRKEIRQMDKETYFLIILAILPLIPAYFFSKPLRDYASQPQFIGPFLIVTSILLFTTSSLRRKEKENPSLKRKYGDVLLIGMMQTLALFPGISRSGSTISAACFRGWKTDDAVRFSFLLAIPTVLGGSVLEIGKSLTSSTTIFSPVSIASYVLGLLSSFGVGLITIRILYGFISRRRLRPFAWYCLILGITSWFAIHG